MKVIHEKLAEIIHHQMEQYILLERLMEVPKVAAADELLDTNDLMRIFKKSDKTIYDWRKRGFLPFIKIGPTYYYWKSEVLNVQKNVLVK